MYRKIEAEAAVRDKLIASLEKENSLQDQLIRELTVMIKTLERQNAELQELLDEVLKA